MLPIIRASLFAAPILIMTSFTTELAMPTITDVRTPHRIYYIKITCHRMDRRLLGKWAERLRDE